MSEMSFMSSQILVDFSLYFDISCYISWKLSTPLVSKRVFTRFSELLTELLFSDNCARGCRNCTSGICSECKQGFTLNRKSKRCVKLCSPADPDVKTRPGCEGKPKGKEGKKKRKGKFFEIHHWLDNSMFAGILPALSNNLKV